MKNNNDKHEIKMELNYIGKDENQPRNMEKS